MEYLQSGRRSLTDAICCNYNQFAFLYWDGERGGTEVLVALTLLRLDLRLIAQLWPSNGSQVSTIEVLTDTVARL